MITLSTALSIWKVIVVSPDKRSYHGTRLFIKLENQNNCYVSSTLCVRHLTTLPVDTILSLAILVIVRRRTAPSRANNSGFLLANKYPDK